MTKKFISVVLVFVMLFSTISVFAEEKKTLELRFDDIGLIIDDYDVSKVKVKYFETDNEQVYEIYDIITNNRLETVKRIKSDISVFSIHPNARPAQFERIIDVYGLIDVKIIFNVMYYSEGSFRSFEGFNGANMIICNQKYADYNGFKLENHSVTGDSKTGSFPCTEIAYWYSGNIVTTTGVNADLDTILIKMGFTKDAYYHKPFSGTGVLKLYN